MKPIFARLAKFDENTGYFEAIAADETLDKSGEIFDYEKSKPNFLKWSEEMSKASGGKNLGNVRSMHGKNAAGKLTSLEFADGDKAIKVAGVVVDPIDKAKFGAGVYTGLSIGGAYGEKWEDPVRKGVMRYEAKPTEVSLVDLPCNPSCTFTVTKADGSSEMRKFHVEPSAEMKAALELLTEVCKKDGVTVGDVLNKVAERSDTSPKEGESKYGDVKFADEKNKKYPIDTEAHIRAAWNYINKPKNAGKYSEEDAKSIKAKIVSAWKAKIDDKGPPSAEKALDAKDLRKVDCEARAALLIANPKAGAILKSLAAMAGDKLEKGLWTVSSLACLIGNLFDIQCSVAQEAAYEGDGSVLPDELKDACKSLGECLVHMAAEEMEELFPEDMEDEGDDVDVMELAAKIETLQKRGARHSAETMGHLKAMHDTLSKMTGGAVCEGYGKAMQSEELTKLAKSSQDVRELIAKALHAKAEDDLLKAAETLHRTLHEAQDGLTKITKERDEFRELMKAANEQMLKAAAEIKRLKALPAPSNAILRPGLVAVTKVQDGTDPAVAAELAKLPPVTRDGKVNDAATAIKKAFAAGGEEIRAMR